jgi:ABC-type glutathione transport system ATPase component
MTTADSTPVLRLDDLDVTYGHGRKAHTAAQSISLELHAGHTLGIVGESGSGKSTVGRAILGLARASRGSIHFRGDDITSLSRRRRRPIAADLQVVFQDPRSSLNEAKTIGAILSEPLAAQPGVTARQARERATTLLDQVGLGAQALDRYPRSFSGGQRQRIAIARALMPAPRLIICDEPTSALDLSVQAQIVNLLRSIQKETGVAYLFIAHDLSIVRLMSDEIAVMRQGRIVEQGTAEAVYRSPRHEYTQRLLAAEPYPDPAIQRERRRAWDRLTPTVG